MDRLHEIERKFGSIGGGTAAERDEWHRLWVDITNTAPTAGALRHGSQWTDLPPSVIPADRPGELFHHQV